MNVYLRESEAALIVRQKGFPLVGLDEADAPHALLPPEADVVVLVRQVGRCSMEGMVSINKINKQSEQTSFLDMYINSLVHCTPPPNFGLGTD